MTSETKGAFCFLEAKLMCFQRFPPVSVATAGIRGDMSVKLVESVLISR
jgi:hypothetical protein